jgi:uncharacterized protein
MNILITGATGLLGKQIGKCLAREGHRIIGVSRDIQKAQLLAPYPAAWIEADLEKGPFKIPPHLSIDGIIHLAGEGVGDSKWTEKQKAKIRTSRSAGTKNLLASINVSKLQFFISASAIGFYGTTDEGNIATESTAQGSGFLADVTADWEKQTSSLDEHCRTCIFRIGVVLSTEGGALPRMIFPAQIFASSSLGSGEQWLSWVHIDDVVNAFVHAVKTPEFRGTFNLVAPHPVQQKEFAKVIAEEMHALHGPPVPSFFLKLVLGEQASLALNSLHVSSEKLQKSGFLFRFSSAKEALSDILSGWQNGAAVKKYEQYFEMPKEKVFEFFAEAKNLEKITPPFLNFRMTNISTEKIQENTLIDYKLHVHAVPISWRTRIESWQPPVQFTDTQLKGPYSVWEHTHQFEDLGTGTLMTDSIRYKLPAGLPGRLVAQAFVDKDIENIFKYRRQIVGKHL